MAASNSACWPGVMRMSANSRIIGCPFGSTDAEILRQRARVAGQRRRFARQHDTALLHHRCALGVREHLAVVAIDDQRADAAGTNLSDDAPDLGDDQRRESFGGFVEDQQPRVGHQRAADGQHLLLAARQLLPAMAEPLGQPRERLHHAIESPVALAVDAGALAHHQVLAHRKVREDAAALGHVADAEPRDLFRRLAGDVACRRSRCAPTPLARSPSSNGSAWSCPCRCGRAGRPTWRRGCRGRRRAGCGCRRSRC